jgi:hypothetical protein
MYLDEISGARLIPCMQNVSHRYAALRIACERNIKFHYVFINYKRIELNESEKKLSEIIMDVTCMGDKGIDNRARQLSTPEAR